MGYYCLVLTVGLENFPQCSATPLHTCATEGVSLHLPVAGDCCLLLYVRFILGAEEGVPCVLVQPQLRKALCPWPQQSCTSSLWKPDSALCLGSWVGDSCPSCSGERPLSGITQGPQARTVSCPSPKGKEPFFPQTSHSQSVSSWALELATVSPLPQQLKALLPGEKVLGKWDGLWARSAAPTVPRDPLLFLQRPKAVAA